ncbi:hypothetical protein TNCV_3277111 [Trichonephila clavipes]|nr:hypothetical protein TNCV_3277111 [Trichonephila clavipes]
MIVSLQTDHLIGTSAHAPQHPLITYTEMGTVGLGPQAFDDGPRNFELWPSDEDDTSTDTPPPFPNYCTNGRMFEPRHILTAEDPLSARRFFSGTKLEFMTLQSRDLDHQATVATIMSSATELKKRISSSRQLLLC